MKIKQSLIKKQALTTILKGLMMSLMVMTMVSCAKHDFIDEQVITGEVGPHAYWEPASSTVSAGSSVPFALQYYSTVSEIDRSELWYSVTESLSKKVSCPWVSTFTYSITSETQNLKRIAEKIESYPHALAVWNDSLSAYTIDDAFSITSTLSSYSWIKPDKFDGSDSIIFNQFFGDNFMQHFKDSLYNLMQYADFRKMILGLNLRDDFKQFTDSTEDKNAGIGVYNYHFPKGEIIDIKVRDTLYFKTDDIIDIVNCQDVLDEDTNTYVEVCDTIWGDPNEIKEIRIDTTWTYPIPDQVTIIYKDSIPFSKLIESPTGYEVEYKRSYSVEALIRVFDTRGIYGTTLPKTIDIN